MEEFDSQTIDDFDFWSNFVDEYAEFPPGPSFPLPLDDEVEIDYYFEDLNNRYRLTEIGKTLYIYIALFISTMIIRVGDKLRWLFAIAVQSDLIWFGWHLLGWNTFIFLLFRFLNFKCSFYKVKPS